MAAEITFGAHVHARAVVARCVGRVLTSPRSGLEPTLTVGLSPARRDAGFFRPPPDGWPGCAWPGLPIPAEDGYLVEPDRHSPAGLYARLRRFTPHSDPTEPLPPLGRLRSLTGIVVGRTWRCEGRIIPERRYRGGGWGTGEPQHVEVDPGCLQEQRRVPLVQVALPPGGRGVARVAFVWTEDLTVQGGDADG
jgi:hypothetical protein